MIRYANQPLPRHPRIAVIANDAIGNFVMATPVLQLLRKEREPASIDFFGGTRTEELQRGSDLFEHAHALHGATSDAIREFLERAGSFDLIVNLESTALAKTFAGLMAGENSFVAGPCMGPGGRGELDFADDDRGRLWQDREWTRETLTSDYPFLRSGFISEIFARLAYLEGELPRYHVPISDPLIAIPDILIATAASLPEKLWPITKWVELVRSLVQKGLSVGLLGAPPKEQLAHWKGGEDESALVQAGLAQDLRGVLSLPQVVGALGRARAVVSLDNGILHLAVAAETPTVGLYRHGIHRLWAPPSSHVEVLTPGEGGEVAAIAMERVLEALERRLG